MGRDMKEIGEPPTYSVIIGGDGLGAVFDKSYKAEILRELWRLKKENPRLRIASAKIWRHLNDNDYPDKLKNYSRASVIFALNGLVAAGIAGFDDATGKGGHHRIYYAMMTEEEFWIWITKQACETLKDASGMPDLFNKVTGFRPDITFE